MSARARFVATPPLAPVVAYRLPSDVRSVGWARRELRRRLRLWGVGGEVASSAELLASELVTNAVRAHVGQSAAAAAIGVRFALAGDRLRLEVRDVSDGVPVVSGSTGVEEEGESECGRGLVLVDALASGWGVVWDGTGKVVWAELTVTAPGVL
ncbi:MULTISPECIES: ATP-binding protein [unclassified Streptomyces]|uniref:ATP-binding protein n=1 Tax=unclassified Streptomyces TaxID=2593676 RepID=UPI000D0F65BF|nr:MULTISPECIES: ATP-binding protein [unclassified Streptomyces]MYT33278.1 ATP-binding protein [Streptomyces sp. SID8354]